MLRNGMSFVTSRAWEHQLTDSETVSENSDAYHCSLKKREKEKESQFRRT